MVRKSVRKGSNYRVRSVRPGGSTSGKLKAYAFGHALGIVGIVGLLLYAVMTWFGGFNGNVIILRYPIGFSFSDWTIIIGLIETYVIGYIGGWIFAKVYNHAAR